MTASEKETLAVYLFSRHGLPLLALPSGDRLPMEPAQVEGVLAVAGGFGGPIQGMAGPWTVTSARYDDYGVIGMTGQRAVVAMVSRETPCTDLVPELERFLRRCEKRLRRRALD